MSLVITWLEARKDSGFKTNLEVLADLNANTGLNITNSRMYEWRAGDVRPSVIATNYMMKVSVLYALRKFKPRLKLKAGETIKLVDMLSIPKKDRKK